MGARMSAGARVDRLLTARWRGHRRGRRAAQTFDGQVVIATGGFERDPALVRAFLRGPMTAPGSPPTNQGDGLQLGMAAGAQLGNMSEAWWAPAMRVARRAVDGEAFYSLCCWADPRPAWRHHRRQPREALRQRSCQLQRLRSFDARVRPGELPAFRVSPSWFVFDAERRARGAYRTARRPQAGPGLAGAQRELEGLAGLLHMQPAALRDDGRALQQPRRRWRRRRTLDAGTYAWDTLQRRFHSGHAISYGR